MENKQVAKQEDRIVIYKVSGEDVKLSESMVNQFIARGTTTLSKKEVVNFIQLCKCRKLNPFLNEAYPIKFGNEPAQLIVGADAFKRKAEENPRFRGYKAGIIVTRNKEIIELEGAFKFPTDIIVGGWAEVYIKDRDFPVVAKVNFAEYDKGKSTWKQIPCTMIRKVALVQALREAFPSDLGAMYSGEELGETEQSNIQVNQEEAKNEIEENANKVIIDIEVPQNEEVVIEAEVVEVANDGPAF